ncbi:MAG: sugar ABC transporter substrate-binding protein [Janthinobacterium lividum]
MSGPFRAKLLCATALVLAGFGLGASTAQAAGPKIGAGPSADAQCFVPWTDKTKFFQYAKKPGPYRVALANGFIGNTWRIQMIKTAKAYAEQPEVKKQLKEFKVVSTGDDIAAQISAVNNFIDSGYDAVIIDAQNPTAFRSVVKRAQAAGVVLVAFDNTLDTDEAINVNVDQEGLGKYWGDWLVKKLPKGGDILEVRGVAGTSVDTDRHKGLQDTLKASGKTFNTVEVVGRWDDGTAQKVSADAIAVHKHFDGMSAQGGSTGMVRAFLDAGAPLVPAAAETENGFRKLCLDDQGKGLSCASGGTGPAQVAVAIKTALEALGGNVVPQSVRLPLAHVEDPGFKVGDNVFPDQTDNFFVGNSFPTCGINFTAQEIMGRSEANQ